MIPDFLPAGHLPPGIHSATIPEFEKRFAYTPWRKFLFGTCVQFLFEVNANIGCDRIFVDGSFTTKKRIPKDVDLCWEDSGIDYGYAELRMPVLFDRVAQRLIYTADIFPAHCIEEDSGLEFIEFFQRIKYTKIPKGIIKLEM